MFLFPFPRSRSTKEHIFDADLDRVQCNEIKSQISELRRIRASVNNELRDLESKRLGLQTEISKQKTELESLRMQQEDVDKRLQQSKLNLDEKIIQEREFSNQTLPLLKAPKLFLFDSEKPRFKAPVTSPERCSMHTCFDYSKCPLLSGFPVYVYDLNSMLSDSHLNQFVKSSVNEILQKDTYVTEDASKACLYIAVLGEMASTGDNDIIQKKLNSLPYWNVDGLNHVLISFARTSASFDLFQGVNTGRAIIVQSSFVETQFRENFDVVLPPLLGKTTGPVWEDLLPLNPIRRNIFLSFEGQFNDITESSMTTVLQKQDSKFKSDQNFMGRHLQAPVNEMNSNSFKSLSLQLLELESTIVQTLKSAEANSKEKLKFNFICDTMKGRVGINGEWALCGSELGRAELLRESTFSIIIAPANFSVISTTVFQTKIQESLKYGSIPVILGDYAELPFSEILDWSRAAIVLPKPRVTELYFLLRTLSNVDVMEFKRTGRIWWETYFGTTEGVISSLLAVLRTRLNIPAHPIREEPAKSSVSNFIPVPQHISKCTLIIE